jgi:arylsulfatase
VSPDYGPKGNAFNGEVNWVEIDVDKAALDEDHILTGAERFHVAIALQ